MKSEQINAARLVRWSQNGEARLTLESAAEWLQEIGCCAFLPPVAGAPPHASLLEAVVGRPAPAPSAGELSRGRDLLARLLESNAALPLRLGTASADADLIISPDILRYFLALHPRGNPRSAPSVTGNERVSTLALHCWELLNERGAMTVSEMQTALGSEMTEAAILRALEELWTHLYAFPLLAGSSRSTPAQWDLIARRFPQQVAAGASTGQAEAYSALISLYIAAVIAAEEEQVLAFLAPVAPQSKLREVIRTLGALRQLDMVDVQGKACLTLAGQGVAMGEWPEAPTIELAAEEHRERPKRPTSEWRSKTDAPRSTFDRRPRENRAGSRDSQGGRDRQGFADRRPRTDRPACGKTDRPAFGDRAPSGGRERTGTGDRGGFSAPRKPFRNGPPRREGDGERRPSFGARPARPWGGPPRDASRSEAGPRKFPRKPAGDRPAPSAGGFKSFRRAEGGESPRPFRPRPKFGEDRGPQDRRSQDRRQDRRPSFHPRGEAASGGPRGSSAAAPFKRRRPEAGAGDGERSPSRWSKPSGPRGDGKRPRTGAPPKRRTAEGRPSESRGGDSPTAGRSQEGAPSKKPFWAKRGLISKSSGRSKSGKKPTGKLRGGKDKGR